MSVIVGSARIDENGKASGGKAGDQTGREVSTQTWYLDSRGWRVFRCKSQKKADLIAQDMEYACENNNIGYDQGQNKTLYTASKPFNFDCSKVKTPCETDCCRLVRVCVLYAGIDMADCYTVTEPKALLDTGWFDELKDPKYTESSKLLQRGDILVTKTKGHTVVVLTDGADVNKPEYYDFSVEEVKNGSRGSSVLLLQKLLYADKYKGKNGKDLELDGIAGTNTVYAIKSFQTDHKMTADGICKEECWKALLGR